MKGKLAFVLGAGVGYVLGTRAGRERYEQIKRAAEKVWQTPPVQRGVAVVRDATAVRVDEFKGFAKRVGADAVSNLVRKVGAAQTGPATEPQHTPGSPASPEPPATPQPGSEQLGSEQPGSEQPGTEQTGAGA